MPPKLTNGTPAMRDNDHLTPTDIGGIVDKATSLLNAVKGLAALKPVHPEMLTPSMRAARLLKVRRKREELFGDLMGKPMFGEPCWDMLLDLYIAWSADRPVSVTSLCVASNVPASTALRAVNMLVERELVTRVPDPLDGRRVHVYLKDETAGLLAKLLSE